MKKNKGSGSSGEHRKEIYGLLFLAIAVFLVLCLFSYNALDPSFTTLAVGKKVQNLGGIVGACLSDLLFVVFGRVAYLVPAALVTISFLHFAGRKQTDNRLGVGQWVAAFFFLIFSAMLAHLSWGEIDLGGRSSSAGGVIGWWLGGRSARFFGRTGAALLTVSGFVLTAVILTRISVLRLAQFFQVIGVIVGKRGLTFLSSAFRIAWARTKREMDRLAVQFKQWRKDQRQPKVHRPVVSLGLAKPDPRSKLGEIPLSPNGPHLVKTIPPKIDVREAVPSGFVREDDASPLNEPKILPRKDLKEGQKREQLELIPPMVAHYQLPQISFLDSESQVSVRIDEDNLKMNSKLLEKKLLDYGVEGRVTEIHPGPIITMYEFEPAAGVKVNKIVNLEDDLALTMGGKSVRIIAPLPGKPAVGIEIPNNERETVWLKDVIGHSKFQRADSKLTLAIGKDTEGIPFVADLAKMPHLLVAGATGSGKSVSVNSMILSLLYKATPDQVRVLFIDLKMLELSVYEGIPHLLFPVITNPKKSSMALRWAVTEMERRYEILAKKGVRNILTFNKSCAAEEKLPYIVIIIDALADLMMTAAKDVEVSITRLAQMARAAGIHLILATQRPSVDVLTGLIKANFPARISFKVSSKHDSRTIIDTVGSEHLLGHGDMLFMSGGSSNLLRIHGAYVSETEIHRVVEHWKTQGEPRYLDESVLKPPEEEEKGVQEDFSDELYDQAVQLVSETRQASISMVQRRLRIGYNRAARMIERMEKEGVVGPADGARPREVYVNNLPSS